MEEGCPETEWLSVQAAGRRGGQTTLARHGPEHFRIIGRKGGETTRELYQQLFKSIGKRGGRPRRPG